MSRLATLSRTLTGLAAAAALALIAAPASHAGGPPPTVPPKVVSQIANELQGDGTYLWKWCIENGTGKAAGLSHFIILNFCENPFADIVAGSVFGPFNLTLLDPHTDGSTGAYGLKFDNVTEYEGTACFGFRLHQDWGTQSTGIVLKYGPTHYTQNTFGAPAQNILMPGCSTVPPVPEPGTMALLGTGALGLVTRLRRRRRSEG